MPFFSSSRPLTDPTCLVCSPSPSSRSPQLLSRSCYLLVLAFFLPLHLLLIFVLVVIFSYTFLSSLTSSTSSYSPVCRLQHCPRSDLVVVFTFLRSLLILPPSSFLSFLVFPSCSLNSFCIYSDAPLLVFTLRCPFFTLPRHRSSASHLVLTTLFLSLSSYPCPHCLIYIVVLVLIPSFLFLFLFFFFYLIVFSSPSSPFSFWPPSSSMHCLILSFCSHPLPCFYPILRVLVFLHFSPSPWWIHTGCHATLRTRNSSF